MALGARCADYHQQVCAERRRWVQVAQIEEGEVVEADGDGEVRKD